MTKARFTITVEADGRGDPPVEIRLRRMLKASLRSYGLRCVAIAPQRPAGERGGDAMADETSSAGDAAGASVGAEGGARLSGPWHTGWRSVSHQPPPLALLISDVTPLQDPER